MLITVSHHNLVDDLCIHFQRSGYQAEAVGGGMIEVARQEAPSAERERQEVQAHLRDWEVANPDVRVELL